ncbi:hypothetical protein F5882DRAFT_415078 [Hyaloscypha sp. PMI_1271]|nr:hypothetical protein F5882DRAFT_415078 [Hyaloscypha sp. PMI_1271]
MTYYDSWLAAMTWYWRSYFLCFSAPLATAPPSRDLGVSILGCWNTARHERRVRPVSLIIDESFPDSMSWAMSRAKFPAL